MVMWRLYMMDAGRKDVIISVWLSQYVCEVTTIRLHISLPHTQYVNSKMWWGLLQLESFTRTEFSGQRL